MTDITKPIYGDIWANAGEKLAPGVDKIATGWIQEMMPYQYENFLQNRTDVAMSYLMQKGVAEWSAEQEYTANKSVVTYGGQLYMATATVTNVLPTVAASWKKLSATFGANGAIPISFGGTGATNAADARTNLGIGSAATVNLPTANGVVVKLADNSLVARTLAGTTGYITVTNGDGVAGNPTINVGANVAKTDADAAWTTKTSIKIPSGTSAERGVGAPGRIRFNMDSGVYEGYDNVGWNPIGSNGTMDVQNFQGNGTKTTFVMSSTPRAGNNTQVYFNGVYQQKTSYNLVGDSLVFDEAPAADISIEVVSIASVAIGTTTAAQTSIVDSGNYYSGTNVEMALAEIGNKQWHTTLSYGTKLDAVAAASTLPNGQEVIARDVQELYNVQDSLLVFIDSTNNYNSSTKKNIIVGDGAAVGVSPSDAAYALIAIGVGALANASESTRQQIAIGRNTLKDSSAGYYNIAIGLDAGMSLNGTSAEDGTRNVILGDNAGRFSVTTNNSIQIGRNANHTAVGGVEATVVGSNAQSGWGPLDFAGGIANSTPHTASYVTATGSKALQFNQADQNSAFGAQAGGNIKKGTANVLSGYRAGANLDSYLGRRGGLKTSINLAATYTQTGTTITVTLAAHGVPTGDYVEISITDGGAATTTTANLLQAQSATVDTFTVNSPISGNFSGNAFIHWRESATPASNQSSYNVAMGGNALGDSTLSASNNVALGQDALRFSYSNNNVAVGFAAGREITTGYSNAFFGRDAGRYMQDGSSNTGTINSVCLGYNSRVSGNGQLQLGDSTVTTYSYGAIQNRSDARDKTDVQDTVLGLAFINDIRAVDYKLDMRDDYVQNNEDGTVTLLPKDGSKKRNRFHHGVIAQELLEVMQKHGVDFGGFQDHSKNGGCDVLSVGYTELIAPLIKAVQELSARIVQLEEK